MNEHIGKTCPYCKTEIREGEPITVCPACGIPHHEGCWEENHGCTTFGCSEQHYDAQHTNPTDVCTNCGTPLGDGQAFCPKCGTPKAAAPKKNVCGKCGNELQDGQEFCPKCGQKAGLAVDAGVNSAISQFNAGVQKKNKKKAVLPIILGAIAVVVVALILFLKGPSVDEIVLAKTSVELKVDDSTSVSYTINPDKAADVEVKWESSNKSVATVSENGKITGKGEGSCTVTVTAGGKSDSLSVTVVDVPDFQQLLNLYCDTRWASVTSDGSCLKIDTNRLDLDDFNESAALSAIQDVNNALGLPQSVYQKMLETRSMDGRQTHNADGLTVSWTYHPDRGLEVMYEIN